MTLNRPTQVNSRGIAEIADFLNKHHKIGDMMTPNMLLAWARDAEFQMSEGNPPCIEIGANYSFSGRPVELTISPQGVE